MLHSLFSKIWEKDFRRGTCTGPVEKKAHYQTAEKRGPKEMLELSTDHTYVGTWKSLKQCLINVEERGNRPQDLGSVDSVDREML